MSYIGTVLTELHVQPRYADANGSSKHTRVCRLRRRLTCSAKSMTPLITVSLSVDTAKLQLWWMLSAMTTVCTLVSGGMM